MHLLNVWSGQFVEKDPRDPETKYAILSHTWDSDGEQTYQELTEIQKRYPPERQPAQDPGDADVQNDLPSTVERHRDHLTASTSHDSVPTTLSAEPQEESPAPSRSQSPSIQSTAATPTAIPPPPNALQGHPEKTLSPMWDDPKLSPKIREACRVAREEGHDYLWIDSCCIDKTSSSELSEAINSMYQWYSRAVVCFAFLADVLADEDHQKKESKFRTSRWFGRGWTLQELLASVYVRFFSGTWTSIGSKHSLKDLITEITNIDENALLRLRPLQTFSVAQRLSWAANRKTSRVEDRAYSLLGLFDINMPTLYGEGHRAFRRLQEEIMRRIPDQTLFAWTSSSIPVSLTEYYYDPESPPFQQLVPSTSIPGLGTPSLFAPSPDLFSNCGGITPVSRDKVVRRLRLQHRLYLPVADYYSTPYGIRTQFPVMALSKYMPAGLSWWGKPQALLLILQCEHMDHPGHLLGRIIYTKFSSHDVESLYSGCIRRRFRNSIHFDLLPLSPARFKCLRLLSRPIDIKTLYIPHDDGHDDVSFLDVRGTLHETINLVLQNETRDALSTHGQYTVNLRASPDHHPAMHQLTLSSYTHTITIKYRHTLEEYYESPEDDSPSQRLTIKADWRVRPSRRFPETTSISESSELLRTAQRGYGTLSWTDKMLWKDNLRVQAIQLPASIVGTEELWLTNSFTFVSKDHYILHIAFAHENPNPAPAEHQPPAEKIMARLRKWVAHVRSP